MCGGKEINMSKIITDFAYWAKDNGWDVSIKKDEKYILGDAVTNRYPIIPFQYEEFLKKITHCVSPNKKFWFLCEDDYRGKSDSAFSWNEFELIALESAENDLQWQNEIKSFWDRFFPICISVNSGYAFYAIDTLVDVGFVRYGFEPEFDVVSEKISSFERFLELIMKNQIKLL